MTEELIRILLFEDNPGDSRLVGELLKESERIKFHLISVDTLTLGISMLTTAIPDLILLDLGLPDSQGLDSLYRITTLIPNIPIIVLTGLNDEDMALKAVRAGAQDYLIKGDFSKDLLIRAIRYSIDRKRTENNLSDNEERLRLALNAAKQGLFDRNLLTGEIITDSNYASMLGYSSDTFIETNSDWLARLHPDERDSVETIYQDYIQHKIPEYRIEYRMRTASGNWKWIFSIGSIVEDKITGRPTRFVGIHADINERKTAALEINRLFEESQRRLNRIESLGEIDTAISSNNSIENTLSLLLDQVKSHLQVDAVAILLLDENKYALDYAADLGFSTKSIINAHIKLGSGLAGKAAQKGEIVHFNQLNDPSIDPEFALMLKTEGFLEYYGISLSAKGILIGVLELYFRSFRTHDGEWLNYFKTLAGTAAIAIENSQLINILKEANKELINAYDATIMGWSMALDLRDKETEGHTQRVAKMTLHLAEKMGIEKDQIIHIYRGSLLHDIGKLGVPDNILLKPAELTEEEWSIMRKHPKFAHDMLSPINYLHPALDIPYCHHEKWDGTGYPNGLSGEQIPLPARIFAIVDVFDALTSDRPYRKAVSQNEALDYIRTQSGKYFDPLVVSEFISYIHC
jgi:PAS domain S-box-containing protein